MPTALYILGGLATASLIGCFGAYLYGSRTQGFRLDKYIAILVIPVLSCLALSYFYGVEVIYFYIVSAVAGFVIEYLVGFTYEKVFGQRMWTYHVYSVSGYTSLLSPLAWGVVGIVFWLLSVIVGL